LKENVIVGKLIPAGTGMPGMPKAKVKSRILMTPEHAKRLLLALQDNIHKFEAKNGKIKDIEAGGIPLNFGGPTAEA
jgi:hypothetical protein